MEPSTGPSPTGPEAPQPKATEAAPPDQNVEQAPAAPEVAPQSKEGANQGATITLPPLQQQPVVAPPKQAPTTDDEDKPQVVDAPQFADDVDVIEKEWVEKAKKIVDESKEDPHKQNKDVSVLKADYMKKRYGKDIKLAKD